MRRRRSLTSGWELAPDIAGPARVEPEHPRPPTDGWQPIVVPGHWQPQVTGHARSTGAAWYRLSVDLEDDWFDHDRLSLEFGAVAHYCQGWLNGHYLGDHEGGHLPFAWPLGSTATPGANLLLVRVVSPSTDRTRYPDFPFDETLHGKQSWYGPTGGIWQDVALEARADTAIVDLHLSPDAEHRTLEVDVPTDPIDEGSLTIEILDRDALTVHQVDDVAPGQRLVIDLSSLDLAPWTLDDPCLYRVRASIIVDGSSVDTADKRFGLRSFESKDGGFLLNGRSVTLRGLLDQDYHDGSGVSPSLNDLRERFRAVKAMGFNLVRCHIKIPDPAYLDAADEVGLLVWCELPTTTRLSDAARGRIETAIDGMIERDRHHPSVVIWGVANEAWGYDLLGNAEHRAWLHHQFHRVKSIAGDRLVVDNSPCVPNFHIETDIEDYHFYAVIPEMRERWDTFLDAFCRRSDFTYSPHGDSVRRGDEPLVVSEFGAWGLPDPRDPTEPEPWWFETGQEWAEGAAYVHGAEERCSLWHLDDVFGGWHELCRAAQGRQFETLRYQIESMRRRPEIAGYVLTELGDVHWEANGLFDMAGAPRSFEDRMPGVNGEQAVMLDLGDAVVWAGTPIEMGATVVNGGAPAEDLEIELYGGDLTSPLVTEKRDLPPGGRHGVEPVEIVAPSSPVPVEVTVRATIGTRGERLGSVESSVLVLPRPEPAIDTRFGSGPLSVGDADLARRLEELSYETTPSRDPELTRVVHQLEQQDQDHVRNGGRLLLLADSEGALGNGFGEFPAVRLRAWNKALFGGGEWVSAFSWLRRTGHFADLPGGPLMDSWFEGLTPNVVITGLPPSGFEVDVFAGVFVGWVHQVRAIIARHRAGLGTMTISTMRLTERPPNADPMATWLLHRLIDVAGEQH